METSSRTTNSGSTAASGVIHKPGFVDAPLCERLIAFWERSRSLTSKESGAAAFFDGRVLHLRDIDEVDSLLGAELVTLAHQMAVAIADTYRTGPLYPDDVQVVKWWEGHEMLPHADMEHPDGSEHPTPWRTYAGVIYLNEHYSGGQIYFPDLEFELAPSQGSFLAFGGGLDFRHGVRKIEQGVRYTCASWFTPDQSRAVDLYVERYC